MKIKYNVLWIDDEWEKQTIFITKCKLKYGIHLEPFKTHKEGMIELERNLDKWDAVLLDAKGYNESVDETATLKGLRKSEHKLHELSSQKKLPYFISTGQPDLIDQNWFIELCGKYYVKELDDDLLLEDMITQMNSLPTIRIRSWYSDVFDTLDTCEYSHKVKSMLTSVLMAMHFPAECPVFEPKLYYNQLRQIIEETFAICLDKNIIPQQCKTNDTVNINQCSLYLAGKECNIAKVRYGNEGDRIIPKRIENSIKSVIESGNTYSHTPKRSVEDKNCEANSKYTLFGLTLLLCDVILWFRDFFQKLTYKEIELLKLQSIEEQAHDDEVSVIECDENGNAHCGDIAIPYKWHKYAGIEVHLSGITKNTNPNTMNLYPWFAKNVTRKK